MVSQIPKTLNSPQVCVNGEVDVTCPGGTPVSTPQHPPGGSLTGIIFYFWDTQTP